jgi:hypothetical protein
MTTAPIARAGLVKAYVFVCVGAYLVAWAFARAGLAWQRIHWHEGYWLIPVNRERIYFVPLAVLGCTVAAARARRASRWLVIAAVVSLIAPVCSIWFWSSVAMELGGEFSPTMFAAAVGARQAHQVAFGSLVLFGLAALALGIRRSLQDRWIPSVPAWMDTPDNNELQRTRPAQTMEPRR